MTDIVKEGGAGNDAFHVNLTEEIGDFAQKRPWQSGIYSKTLLKKNDLRIVLIAMEASARMPDHHADGTVSIQVLKGAVQVNLGGRKLDLRMGHLLSLTPSTKHDVEALEESAFLLTISWPSSAALEGMQHRGYGA